MTNEGYEQNSEVTACLEQAGNMLLILAMFVTCITVYNSVLSKSRNHVVDLKDLEDLEDLLQPLPVVVVTGVHL